MVKRREVPDTERDMHYIRNPNAWRRWPVCPVVKRGGTFQDADHCGVVLCNHLTRVYFCNMFDLGGDRLAQLEQAGQYRDFPSVAALVVEFRVD